MKKYVILSLTFLAVFILLIFQSSFCWASESYDFDNDFFNDALDYIFTDAENYNFYDSSKNYNLICYVKEQNSYFYIYFYFFTNYSVSGSNINFVDGWYYSYATTDKTLSTFDSSNISFKGVTNPNYISISYLLGDQVTYLGVTTNIVDGNTDIISYSDFPFVSTRYNTNPTMTSVVSDISLNLGLDTLYLQLQNSIPVIVVAVLFVIGFIIVRKLFKGFSKGKLKI